MRMVGIHVQKTHTNKLSELKKKECTYVHISKCNTRQMAIANKMGHRNIWHQILFISPSLSLLLSFCGDMWRNSCTYSSNGMYDRQHFTVTFIAFKKIIIGVYVIIAYSFLQTKSPWTKSSNNFHTHTHSLTHRNTKLAYCYCYCCINKTHGLYKKLAMLTFRAYIQWVQHFRKCKIYWTLPQRAKRILIANAKW